MNEQLDFLKCYYKPSFFRMKIDVPLEFNNIYELTDGTLALYLHEYIHFLQDISTIYGLMNISTITYYIQDCASRINKEKKKNFKTPMEIQQRDGDHGYNNFKLKKIYLGAAINPKKKSITLINYCRKTISDFGEPLEIIDIEYQDNNTSDKFTGILGGNLITEGMAYLSEQHIYSEILAGQGINLPADEYPYLVVEKLAQLIYPKISSNKLILIAICDCSLMTYNPGLSYVKSLEYLKEINFHQNVTNETDTINEIYKLLSPILKGNHVDFSNLIEIVKADLLKHFNMEHLDGNRNWINIIFGRIKNFRNNRPQFILDILMYGDLKQNELFKHFYINFGSPLVLNSDDNATIALPIEFDPISFKPESFWAINQIAKIFADISTPSCEMKQFCKNSNALDPNLIVDDRCDKAPWERSKDSSLCPVGMMWKHWALSEFSPTTK